MTQRQLEILQHSLGLDKYGRGKMYRNHFCAGASDEPDCRALVAAGLMQEHAWSEVFPYYNVSVTEAGEDAVRRESPAAPKLTRSQKRFRRFQQMDTGESFGEWLKYYGRSKA